MLKSPKNLILAIIMLGAIAVESCEKTESGSNLEETILVTENSYQQLVDLKIESEKISKALEFSLFNEDGTCEVNPSNIRERMKESMFTQYGDGIIEFIDNSNYGYFLEDSIFVENEVVFFGDHFIEENHISSDVKKVFDDFIEGLSVNLENLDSQNFDNIDVVTTSIKNELISFELDVINNPLLKMDEKMRIASSIIILRDNVENIIKYSVLSDFGEENTRVGKCNRIKRLFSAIITWVFILAGFFAGASLGAMSGGTLLAISAVAFATFGWWIGEKISWWLFNCTY